MMTQASGVKTMPDMKRAFEARGPKLQPHFFDRRDFSSNDYLRNCHSERSRGICCVICPLGPTAETSDPRPTPFATQFNLFATAIFA